MNRSNPGRHERRIPVPQRRGGQHPSSSLLLQPHQRPPPDSLAFPRSFPGAAPGAHFPHHPPPQHRRHHGHQPGYKSTLPLHQRQQRVRCESTQENIRRPFHQQTTGQPPMTENGGAPIPGFYWDPIRRKHFRIQPSGPGPVGLTNADLLARRREQERLLAVKQPYGRAPKRTQATSMALATRELTATPSHKLARQVREGRLWGLGSLEPERVEVETAPGYTMDDCCFLESGGKGGTCLLGVWQARASQRVLSFQVGIEGAKATETRHGLTLRRASELERTTERVVDLCMAPVDSCVTCVLYVSMPKQSNCPYRISMAPVLELSSVDDADILDSPVYNIDWRMPRDISSVAWNAHKMRMGLGMGDGYGLIVDVVSETDFRLSTRHQRVWAQEFSRDGDLVFLGLNGGALLCADLRLPAHHTTYDLPHAGVHWMRLLTNQPHQLLAASLDGGLALWDLRMRRPLRRYPGHVNSHSRLSVAVEEEEGVVVSAGEDGTTRAWSLQSGELLCAVPCPVGGGIVPRAAYRSGWARTPGAAALILAARNDFFIYHLKA